jgi:hypothetical protein
MIMFYTRNNFQKHENNSGYFNITNQSALQHHGQAGNYDTNERISGIYGSK